MAEKEGETMLKETVTNIVEGMAIFLLSGGAFVVGVKVLDYLTSLL